MAVPDHDHDDLLATDPSRPGDLIRAYFEHVRDVHGHDVNSQTPMGQITDLHRKDHD